MTCFHLPNQRQVDIIVGYIKSISFHTPFGIMQTISCFLFFVLDEWKITSKDKYTLSIHGLQRNICKFLTNKYQTVYGKNIIYEGVHKWTLQVLESTTCAIMVGVKSNKSSSYLCKTYPQQNRCVIEIYLNLVVKTLNIMLNGETVYDRTDININRKIGYKLQISSSGMNTSVQILSYHNLKWYRNILHRNMNDPFANAGYAETIYNIDQKIKYYRKALNILSDNHTWNDEYLLCLITKKQHQYAYECILKWKHFKAIKSISKLANYFYDQQMYRKALQLVKRMDKNIIIDNNVNYKIYICEKAFHDN
eukprot:125213_1